MRRKICVLTTVHTPADHRLRKEARSLMAAGYEVVTIAPAKGNQVVDGARVRALSPPVTRWERMTRTVWRLWRAAREEHADAYHIHDPELLVLGLMLAATGKRVVYDRHEDVPRNIRLKQYLPAMVRVPAAAWARTLERIAATVFAGVVLATDQMSADFTGARRAVPVRNFPDLAMFEGVEAGRNRTDGLCRVVYAGSIAELRGVTQLVEAMGLMPEDTPVRLVLCGTVDPPGYLRRLQALPGWRWVELTGLVEHHEVPAVLASCDIGLACLQPTDTYVDAVPTKLYEYLAAGLPVVASDFPPYRPLVVAAQTGLLVDPTDPCRIAEAITILARDPDRRRACGARGRALAPRFAWQGEGERLAAMYHDILAA